MNYLKFNCYDLAAQGAELYGAYSKLRALSEELAGVISALDPQIKSYENIQRQLTATHVATVDIGVRVRAAHSALDQIVDVYYAAENRVMDTVTELPTDIAVSSGRSTDATAVVQASSIIRGDLIVEDWLAELIYKNDDINSLLHIRE